MVNESNIIAPNISTHHCADERAVMLDKNLKSPSFGYNFLEEHVGAYGEPLPSRSASRMSSLIAQNLATGSFIAVELCFSEEAKDGKAEFVDLLRPRFVADRIKGFGMIRLVDCENGVTCRTRAASRDRRRRNLLACD
jgi:hypothetical protein